MPRISMLVPDEALRLIDAVSGDNRTAFMVNAALGEARKRRRELLDAEVALAVAETAGEDRQLDAEFAGTLIDGLDPDEEYEDPCRPL